MGKSKKRRNTNVGRARHGWRSRALVAAAVVLVLAAGGAWWLWPTPEAEGGTPRFVVDRDTIDLGDFPFNKMASASFTITNAGDGTLKLTRIGSVKALEGC